MTTTPRASLNKLKAFQVLYRSSRPLMAWEIARLAKLTVQADTVRRWLIKWQSLGLIDRRPSHKSYAYWLTTKGKEYAQSLEGGTP